MSYRYKFLLCSIACVSSVMDAATSSSSSSVQSYVGEDGQRAFSAAFSGLQAVPGMREFIQEHEVSSNLSKKIDAILNNKNVIEALQPRDIHLYDRLEDLGFTFMGSKNVFSHRDLPGYIFKLPDSFSGGVRGLLSRVWNRDYLLAKDPTLIIPQMWIYRSESPFFQGPIVVEERIDLVGAQRIHERSPEAADLETRLHFTDFKGANVFKKGDRIIIVDTKSVNNGDTKEFLADPLIFSMSLADKELADELENSSLMGVQVALDSGAHVTERVMRRADRLLQSARADAQKLTDLNAIVATLNQP